MIPVAGGGHLVACGLGANTGKSGGLSRRLAPDKPVCQLDGDPVIQPVGGEHHIAHDQPPA